MTDIVGLSLTIFETCGKIARYAKAVKDGPGSCRKFQDEVGSIPALLAILLSKGQEQKTEDWAECTKLLVASDGPLLGLRKLLQEVDSKLESLDSQPTSTIDADTLKGKPKQPRWYFPFTAKTKSGPMVPTAVKTLVPRARWPFTEAEVNELLSTIERYKSWIQLGLGNDNLELTRQIKGKVDAVLGGVQTNKHLTTEMNNKVNMIVEDMKVFKENYNLQQIDTIFAWLTPLNFGKTQQDIFSRWQEGTGQWLLDHEFFIKWVTGTTESLFCHGIPGAGKSVMASMVIDRLELLTENQEDVGLVYLYCNYKEQDKQTMPHLLGSILHQLSSKPLLRDSIVRKAQELHQKHAAKQTRPTVTEISELLRVHFARLSRVYIVIDALDECKAQNELMHKIRELHCDDHGRLSVIVTSRPRDTKIILGWFRQDSPPLELEIQASDSDIRQYLQKQLQVLQQRSSFEIPLDLLADILNVVSEKADKMFLLAKLHMDAIAAKHSVQEIQETLKSLPSELDDTYNTAMKRIYAQSKDDSKLAALVLTWITTAFRPLSIAELQHAIAIDGKEGLTEFDNSRVIAEDAMIRVCSGLVAIEPASRRIRLVHYTTQEYFDRHHQRYFPAAHEQLVATCLTYMSFDTFKSCCTSGEELRQRVRDSPLLKYAVVNWSKHAEVCAQRGNDKQIMPVIFKFFERKGNVAFNIQLARARDYSIRGTTLKTKVDLYNSQADSGILVATFFAINSVVMAQVENGMHPNSLDSEGRSALSIAAELGNTDLVKSLLSLRDLELNSKDRQNSRTPLMWAVRSGHAGIVELLLNDPRVDPNTPDDDGWTPLRWAAANRNETITKVLVAHAKVDPTRKDENGWTPITWAIDNANDTIIRVLVLAIHQSAHILKTTEEIQAYQKLWPWAIKIGDHAVISALVAIWARSKPSSRYGGLSDWRTGYRNDRGSQIPLHLLVEHGHLQALAEMLKVDGVDPNVTTNCKSYDNWQTALYFAAGKGDVAAVKLILSLANTQVNGTAIINRLQPQLDSERNWRYERKTPLYLAVKNSHEEVIKLLLGDRRINANLGVYYDSGIVVKTPLSRAILNGDVAIAKLLLASEKVDVNYIPGQAFYAAASAQHESIVRLLLGNDQLNPNQPYTGCRIRWPAKSYSIHEKICVHVYPLERAVDSARALAKQSESESGSESDRTKPFRWCINTGPSVLRKSPNVEVVEAWLASPKVDAPFRPGFGVISMTVLHIAIYNAAERIAGRAFENQVECLTTIESNELAQLYLLIGHPKISLEVTDQDGYTPLEFAVRTIRHRCTHEWKCDILNLMRRLLQSTVAASLSSSNSGKAWHRLDYNALVGIALDLQAPSFRPDQLGQRLRNLYRGTNHKEHLVKQPPIDVKIVRMLLEWPWASECGGQGLDYKTLLASAVEVGKGSGLALRELLQSAHKVNVGSCELNCEKLLIKLIVTVDIDVLERVSCIKCLVESCKNINLSCLAIDSNGESPLRIAIEHLLQKHLGVDHVWPIIDALMDLGTLDPNMGEGTEIGTTLHAAIESVVGYSYYDRIVYNLLEWKDLKPDLRDSNGRTPLSHAAGHGQLELVKRLLERDDVDPVSKDNMGRTPLEWAFIGGHTEVVEMLSKYQIYDPDSWMLED